MIFCHIVDGVVADRAVFDGDIPDDWPDREQWVANEEAQIGWRVIEGTLVPEEPALPLYPAPRLPNLEPDQFWFVVRASGYEPDLLAWVASMNDADSPNYDPVDWAAASSKLQFAKFFERDHPFVEAARVAIGMSEAELDALWQFAAS